MLMIAYDCGHGWLHVHADWASLEPVDEQRRPVPVGERSATVLLTNLANRIQPIIRVEGAVGVRSVQVVQTGPGALAVRLDTAPGHDDATVAGRRGPPAGSSVPARARLGRPAPRFRTPAAQPHSGKLRPVIVAPRRNADSQDSQDRHAPPGGRTQ
jgi:hypothetical protein